MSDGKKVALRSVALPDIYLRLDGRGITSPSPNGAGVLNCQFGHGPWEVFVLENNDDGSTSIASVQYPGCYVRLDGTGVTQKTPGGGGVANVQFGIGRTERFQLEPQDDGSVAFLSTVFPVVYLRLDGGGVTHPLDNGGGVANAQYTAGPMEMFTFVYL